MVDFIPPQDPEQSPAPLSPTVPLNPPMVGEATPFDHVDGQNRDLILEAIRAWARGPLRAWTGAWQDYQGNWYTSIRDWLATWEQATIDYVVGKVAEMTEYVDTSVADLTAYVDAAVASIIENSIELQDAVLAGIVADSESQARQRLDALYGSTIRLNSTNFPLLVMDGTADMGAVLTGIANALPDVAELEIDGHLLIESTWDIPTGKDITIRGGKITYGGDVYSIIRQSGEFEAIQYVSSLVKQTALIDNANRTTHVITLPSPVTWKRGDTVRVFGDDVIPAAHITSNLVKPRIGEFATVYSVSGNTVTLSGLLRETYTTNIRVARLDKSTRFTCIDVEIDVTDARLTAGVGGVIFRLKNIYAPRIIRTQIGRATGIIHQFDTCVHPLVEDPSCEYAMNAPVAGGEGAALGYLVHDSGSMHTRVMGGVGIGGRHFFTDGASLVEAGTPDPAMYGATIGAEVHDSVAKYFKAAAYDTHHMTKDVQFVNVTVHALDEVPCITLRGRDSLTVNPIAYGGSSLINLVTQDTTITGVTWSRGETYGHKVINPTTFGTALVYDAGLRRQDDHPFKDVRYTVPNLTIQGGTFHDLASITGAVQNAYVQMLGSIYCHLRASLSTALMSLNNTRLVQRGTLTINGEDVTTVTGSMRVISAVDTLGTGPTAGSYIDLDQVNVSGSDAFSTAFGSTMFALTANTKQFKAKMIDIDLPVTPTNPVTKAGTVEAGSLKYRWKSRDRYSGAIALVDDEIATLPLAKFGAMDDTLYITCSPAAGVPRTLAALPAGQFPGQEARIMSTSTTATTLQNAGGNIAGLGADKNLTAVGMGVRLTFTGTNWRQIAAPA